MTKPTTERSVLITGAGRGIGRAIALSLAGPGTTIFLTGRTAADLEQTARQVHDLGGTPLVHCADLAEESQIVQLFSAVKAQRGSLDICICNAGVGHYGPVAQLASKDLDQMYQVNVRGVFLCCREALGIMQPARSGYIILLSSVVGFKGYPDQAAYGATKHAVMGLAKSLAAEAQPFGIRVSAILPGGVDTEMVRQSRPDLDTSVLLHPEDVAQSVQYLLSLSERAAVDQIYLRRRASAPF